MSDKHANLDRSDSDINIDKNLEREHDSEIDAILKDNTVEIDSICHLFGGCLRKYGILLLTLQTDALRSTRLVISLVSDIKDEFSRLRIWGEQTYAILPLNARRSLDEQLREDEDTRKVVINCLRRLNNHVEKAIEQIKRGSPMADIDSDDEEYSSLSDESDAALDDLDTAWEIRFRKTIALVFEGICTLYRVSALLRYPRNSSLYLRSSISTAPSQTALRDTLDYAHVSDRMRSWRRLTRQSEVGGDEGHLATDEENQSRKEDEQEEIAEIAFLYQRFTWANLSRRKQLDYWTKDPDEPEIPTRSLEVFGKSSQQKGKNIPATSTSLSTIAKSALRDNTEGGQLRTGYAGSAVGRSNTTRVPDVPKCSRDGPNFECPFCHVILDSELMQERKIWEEHVFEDLRPYVCSFENCPNPGRLFETRYDWVYHEQQIHRRHWVCPDGCNKELPSKADMVQHLLFEHSSVLDDRRLSTYADMCEREVDDTKIEACLICLEEMSLSRLYEHLAMHMEEVALFVLPTNPDDKGDEQTEAQHEIERPLLAQADASSRKAPAGQKKKQDRQFEANQEEMLRKNVPGSSSQLAFRPLFSRRNEVVVHRDPPRHRPEPRQELHYAGEIGVRTRNWRLEFNLRRLGDGRSRPRRRCSDDESRRTSGEVMLEAPPPPPDLIPPPSAMSIIMPLPNQPIGTTAAYTTRDTVLSSSSISSRTSSTRSIDTHQAVHDLPMLTVPASGSSVTSSRHARSIPGLSRLRVESRPKFHDTAYGGSSNISPIDALKTDTFSETHSNPISERTASMRYNYTNQTAVAGREDYDTDDKDKKSNSSEGRKRYHRLKHVRIIDDPEMTQRKMQEDIKAVEEHQSQTGEQGDGSIESGSGSRRRRYHQR